MMVYVPVRSAILLMGVLVIALSCTGPQPEQPEDPEEAEVQRIFHVQLHMTEEKDEADRVLGEALSWWEGQPSSERPPLAESEGRPVDITWKAPLYRVRLGPFATREHAESVLSDARSEFPEAFVAPERVPAQ